MKTCIIAKQRWKFMIDADIIQRLIEDLLFHRIVDDKGSENAVCAKKRNASKPFVHNQKDDAFVADVKF